MDAPFIPEDTFALYFPAVALMVFCDVLPYFPHSSHKNGSKYIRLPDFTQLA